jgi:2-polyprenyl-3-methyl-5-hydroxy-6-metoxy-1,4-benzoquinol methylase
MSDPFGKWSSFYADADEKILRYPNEPLVRMIKGNYIPNLVKEYEGKKVLDIGFGHGNNLFFLSQQGFQLYGIEVQEEICSLVGDRLARQGISSDLRQGTNREIPFDNNMFDALVSWDVLHYEANEENLCLALQEYHRVLKPGGRLYLSTIAPQSSVLRQAEIIGSHRYQLSRGDDFRQGEVFFCCDFPEYLQYYLAPCFNNVYVGRSTDDLFAETYDSFVATGLKRETIIEST